MAFVLADRVRETTTTTGTGTITLGGAAQSYQTFASAIGNTNTTYYAIAHQNANEFEVGLGTVSTSGSNTLARTTVLKSSNSNSAVDFSAGTKDVFVTYPSEKAVTTSDAQTLTNKTIDASQLSGTVANARLDAQLQDVAGLAVTNGNFIVGDGSNFVAETGATARTSLGLGTAAVLDTGISNTNVAKFTSGVADDDFLRVDGVSIEGRSASEVLSDIGAQASDAQLTDVAGLAVTNGNFIVGDGSNFVAESGATARTSLGLGTAAVLDTGISNTNVAKFTSGVADNDFLRVDGTDIEGRSASEVLSDIGAQASDAQLTDVAGLAVTDGNFIVGDGSNFVAESGATARTSLGLGVAATKAYEEGTYTPAISFGGGTTGIGYSNQVGFYTKIGRLCFVTVRVTLSSKGSSSGVANITLPFTAANINQPGAEPLNYGANFGMEENEITIGANQNAASALFFTTDGGSSLTDSLFNNNSDFQLSLVFMTA